MFMPLTKKEIAEVVRLQMNEVAKMLKQQFRIKNLLNGAIDFLADVGYDPNLVHAL